MQPETAADGDPGKRLTSVVALLVLVGEHTSAATGHQHRKPFPVPLLLLLLLKYDMGKIKRRLTVLLGLISVFEGSQADYVRRLVLLSLAILISSSLQQ